jgi:peroxin-7
VRRVKFSPVEPLLLLSCSFDLSVGVWDLSPASARPGASALRQRCEHHTEFVTGIDFSLFPQRMVASCSWDRSVALWPLGEPPPPRMVKIR